MTMTLSRPLSWLAHELGLQTMRSAGLDVYILILSRYLRLFAYGAIALILALYFSRLGFSDAQIGLFMTLTLLGDVVISLFLTLVADALGRRRTLFLGALAMAVSGAVFALTSNYIALLLAAVVGVISPTGNEIGPFRAVEESVLAGLVREEGRSDVFTWYVVCAVLGSSSGLVVGGVAIDELGRRGWDELEAYRAVFWIYTAAGVGMAALTMGLSGKCERGGEEDATGERAPLLEGERRENTITEGKKKAKWWHAFSQISKPTRWTLGKLCSVFFLDSLASGMVPFSLINFYLERKFDLNKGKLGGIMSATWYVVSDCAPRRHGLTVIQVHLHHWQRFRGFAGQENRPYPGHGSHASPQRHLPSALTRTTRAPAHHLPLGSASGAEQHGPGPSVRLPLHRGPPPGAHGRHGHSQHPQNAVAVIRTLRHRLACRSRAFLGGLRGSRIAQGYVRPAAACLFRRARAPAGGSWGGGRSEPNWRGAEWRPWPRSP